jgi:DinB family protein
MILIWTVIPKFRRFPRCVEAVDRCNAALWRWMGMRTVESAKGKLTPANAAEGRFLAPVFLRPTTGLKGYDELIEWRRCTRDRSLRAIASVDEETLNTLRWSHPLLGSYTLMEFAQFLGIHEGHHLPQIQRIRGAEPGWVD